MDDKPPAPRYPHAMSITARQAAKIRKRQAADLKRERAAIARAEFERLAAIRIETAAENQAPKAQRLAVVLEDGAIVRDALAEPDLKRGGFRRIDPLRRMHMADASVVTRLHLAAARKFSEDYEIGIEGASSCGGVREFVDGGGMADVPELRLAAMARYRTACDALGGTLRVPVQLAALHRFSVARMAPLLGMSQERASGFLVAALDRLADHYWPDRVVRYQIKESFVVDPAVRDIAQERLGRWKRPLTMAG